MNRKGFLNELDMGLGRIPYSEKKEILSDYEEHFNVGLAEGKTEEEIIKKLGDPKKIAKEYSAEFLINRAVEKKSFSNIVSAVFAALGLGIANLIIVFPIWISIIAVVISLFVSSIAIALAGLIVLIASPFVAMFPLLGLGGFLSGLVILCLGILMMIGFFYLSKGIFKITISYLRSNVEMISGRRFEKWKNLY